MSKISQTASGKALEYGLAFQCANLLGASLAQGKPHDHAKKSYGRLPATERRNIDNAAKEAVMFLQAHDSRLSQSERVTIQSDMQGQEGDVRDVVLTTKRGEVGISAKQRNASLKHSRLSDLIDFGQDWYGKPCSSEYWRAVKPIFANLRKREKNKEKWADLQGKHARYYLPLLRAFMDEISKHAVPEAMMRYVLGRHDFYKIIKQNGNVSIQSFNINGTLGWGKRVPMPQNIVVFGMKPESQTTAILVLDRGWQIAFRLHSAESRIVPSLKFDITVVGNPQELSVHQIPYSV